MLATGGLLGFHRGYIMANGFKEFVEFRIEERGETVNPAEDAYDQGITGAVHELKYMGRHGVNDDFMLEMLAVPPREIWTPSRAELVTAGIINAD